MQPTPLRVDKIGAILASRCARTSFRSIGAARLMGKPLARAIESRTIHHSLREGLSYYALTAISICDIYNNIFFVL
jgi:hypothetical protein